MAEYESKNVKKGQEVEFVMSFDEPKGPYEGKGGKSYLYGVRSNGEMYNLWLPVFVGDELKKLGAKKGDKFRIKNLDYQTWEIGHNGQTYYAKDPDVGEATETARGPQDVPESTPDPAAEVGVPELAARMRACYKAAETILGDFGTGHADIKQQEMGLTARCMFIQLHKGNHQ